MLEITGYDIKEFQRCDRLYRIGLTHRVAKWRPTALLGACLRHAIFNLSNGGDVMAVADKAALFFIAAAREPGLDIYGVDTYTLTMDYVAIIRNVIEYLSRMPLLKLHDIPPVMITPDIRWKFLSHADDSGVLHRWEFVDFIPEDKSSDVHSWNVYGDIAAGDSPMVLHYLAIGRRAGSHQNSAWCRTFKHPTVANIFRFNKTSGDGLKESWKPVYFSDNQKNSHKTWVDWMENDNTPASLVQKISVRQVSDEQLTTFRSEVETIARRMGDITSRTNPRSIPMTRYGCDHPYTCPHQTYCYSSKRETLDSFGFYKKVSLKSEPVGV